MKIPYSHLSKHILEKPTIHEISDSLFQLGHEHEIEGNIFNIELTPNRGDCLSLNGVLRDLAVFYSVDFNQDIHNESLKKLSLDFENLSESICPKISFLKIEIDTIPSEYKDYLNDYFIDLSLNKNNFFTDISNYLSYETGQPTHCYDAKMIDGKIIFKEINQNTEFETLLDKKITLSNKNAVFLLNNEVINLAGIVGDKSTACKINSTTVLIECAYFRPDAIIGKSLKYDVKSDASHKFERGVDQNAQENVLRRFIRVVSDHAQIKDMSMVSYNTESQPDLKIPLVVNKINQILGIDINEEEYIRYLLKLGFSVEDGFVIAPSFRSDIQTTNDLAEEIARCIGYDNIDLINIDIPQTNKTSLKEIENKLRYFLLDHGFYEVINSPFVKNKTDQAIKVDNPLDSNRKYLRTNITNSLLENLKYNENRQKDSIKLFEISDIYLSNDNSKFKRKLSVIASGRVGLNFEDFSKKINKKYLEDLFNKIYPNNNFKFRILSRDSLDTKIKNEIISLEVEVDLFPNEILSYKEISKAPNVFNQYNSISEQPSSFKDISYLIKDYDRLNDLQDLLLNYKNDTIKHTYIFDYFVNEKKEEIKIGFRFIFQSQITTLTAVEIDLIYNDIVNKSLEISGIEIPGM